MPKNTADTLTRHFTACNLEDSLVLSDGDTMLLILNPAGRRVWEGLMEGVDPKKIAEEMAEEFDTPVGEVEPFVTSLVTSLLSHASREPERQSGPMKKIPSPPSPHGVHTYALYGKSLQVRYGNALAETALHPLLRHAETSKKRSSGKPPITCEFIQNADESYTFAIDGIEKVREASIVYVKGVAVFEIFSALHPDRSWLAVFHGAAVKRDDRASLLLGKSGDGKSTLAAALSKNGFDLMSDDLAVIEKGSVGVMETPFALALKKGSWEVLSPLIPEIPGLPRATLFDETLAFFAPSPVSSTLPSPDPVQALYFVRYDPGTPFRVTGLTAVEALSRLTEAGAWISHEKENLEAFLAWLGETPAYELHYSDLSPVIDLLSKA